MHNLEVTHTHGHKGTQKLSMVTKKRKALEVYCNDDHGRIQPTPL